MDTYLLLAVAEGCGAGMVPALLDPATSPDRLLADPPRLPPAVARRMDRDALQAEARSWLLRAQATGQRVLTPTSAAYPERLRPLPLRPNALFARGDVGLLAADRPAVAVVGSRTHTAYGEAAARDFGAALARAGVVIWSGLAYGIDQLAHAAAVEHRRPTVAVLAGGLDRIYPAEHEQLAVDIVAAGGLLLSEAPPGLRAQRGHFPRRNRILAGGAGAVLVVEAGLNSGSLHTARFALDYGAPVFAVPGPYTSPRSLGCHTLIAQGAHIAASPAELLRDLGVQRALADPGDDERAWEASADAEAVLRVLAQGPRPADLVAREARLEAAPFAAAVLGLCGSGLVRRLPGDRLGLVSTGRGAADR